MATSLRVAGQPVEDKTGDEAILIEAKERFDRCREWESDFRSLYIADVKFANGDPDNGWQWPDDVRGARGGTGGRDVNPRPCLTINKVAPLILLITNDARQNKPNIKIRPTGEHDSYEAAQVFEGIIRYIERKSRAQTIYDECVESQVEGGIAYWLVGTEYIDEDSFDQDIRILPVRNQLNVYLDRDIKQKDGSDARYGFIFDELDEKEFKKQYPNVDVSTTTGFDATDDWVKKDDIRVSEYYRIIEKADELIYLEDEKGVSATFKRSDVPAAWKSYLAAAEKSGHAIKKRKIKRKQLQWFKIAGDKIIDRRDLPGKYIPIIRLPGREKVIEGRLDRKGHTRVLKDAQRMYNYNTSANVEFGSLQTKTPYLVAAAAIEGNQQQWFNANRNNAAVLLWKHMDADGQQIPEPKRIEPPVSASAALEGMKIADAEMMMASGQNPAQQGKPYQERSGKAIAESQRQGDTATYHFVDNLRIAIAHCGNVILDLIPHYYDTERVVQILARDGTQQKIFVQPQSKEPYKEEKERDTIKAIFNPSVGRYDVESDIGPAYSTQRQESWNAFIQIVSQSPELTAKIGDLGFLSADFPMAEEIAERLRRDIKANAPWLLDDDEVGPFVKKLQEQLQQAQQDSSKKDQTISELLTNLAEANIKQRGKDEMRDIDAYEAETRRQKVKTDAETNALKLKLDVLTKLLLRPDQKAQYEHELRTMGLEQDHELRTMGQQHIYNKIEAANEASLSQQSDSGGDSGGG